MPPDHVARSKQKSSSRVQISGRKLINSLELKLFTYLSELYTRLVNDHKEVVTGIIIGVAATAAWAICTFAYGWIAGQTMKCTLKHSISVESTGAWRCDPFLRIENSRSMPIDILQVEIIGVTDYDYRQNLQPLAIRIQEEYSRDVHPRAFTLQPKQAAEWIFVRQKMNVEACYVYVEYWTPLRDRNFLKFRVGGDVFRDIKEQFSWEDDEPPGVLISGFFRN